MLSQLTRQYERDTDRDLGKMRNQKVTGQGTHGAWSSREDMMDYVVGSELGSFGGDALGDVERVQDRHGTV